MSQEISLTRAQVLEGLSGALARLREIQGGVANDLYAGEREGGGTPLAALLSSWGEFLGAVRETVPALPPSQVLRVQAAAERTAAALRRVEEALGRRDWIETADLLSLDVEDLFGVWADALVPSPEDPAQ